MAGKIQPKNQEKDPKTPSGKFDAPLEVALTGSMLGGSVTDFETLIVRTVSQVIYGDIASTAKSINDIKSFAKKNQNPFDVAENILKKIESLEKLHKATNNILRPIASSVVRLAMFTGSLLGLAASNTGFVVTPTEKPNIPGQTSGDPAQTIKVAIESNNLDEILKSLSDLSGDGSLSTLADVFEVMVDNSKEFKEIAEYMQPFSESLAKLIEQNSGIEEFNKIIDPFIKGMNNMSKIQFVDSDELTRIGDALLSFSQTNINEADIDKIINSTKTIIDNLSNVDLSKIDASQFDKLIDISDKIKELEKIQGIDLASLDDLIINVPKINLLVEQLGKVEKFKKTSLSNFSKFIDWVGTITFPNIPDPKNLIEYLKQIDRWVIPNSVSIMEQIKQISITKTLEQRLESLKLVLTKLSELNFDTSKLKITDKFADNIKKISEFVPDIESLGKNVAKLKVVKLDDIKDLSKILKRLSELEFNGGGEINIGELKTLVKSIPGIESIIKEFDKRLTKRNYKELLATTAQIKVILQNLDEMSFSGQHSLNYKRLDELANNVFPYIGKSVDAINGVKTTKETLPIISSLVEILDELDLLEFKGKRIINKNKLEEFNDSLPVIITVCQKINAVSIEDGSKTVKNIAKSLNVIGEIDTEPFQDKDFTKVTNALVAFIGISTSIKDFDIKSINTADAIKEFVQVFIENDDAPIKVLSNSSTLSDFVKKKDDIEKLANTTESLANAIKAVAALGALGAMVTAGVKVIKSYVLSIQDIIQNIDSIDSKKVESAMQTMKGMALIIAVSTICMLLGGFFVVKMPELVIGALAFGLVLSVFIFTVLYGINYATKGMDTSMANLKDVAILVVASTFVMILGATFILFYPKLVMGAIAFTLVLALFLASTLLAINLGTKGINIAQEKLREVIILISVSTFILILGALVVTQYPWIALGAIGFTVLLGGFLFATLQAIKFGTKGLEKCAVNLYEFAILIGVASFVLILGGLIVTQYPWILLGAMGFTVALGLFLFATLKAINLGTKGIEQALPKAQEAALLIAISAGIMIAGGTLFILFPQLMLTIPVFIAMQTLMFGSLILICKMLNTAKKDINKAIPILKMLGLIVALSSAAMIAVGVAITTAGGFANLMLGVLAMELTLVGIAGIAIAVGLATKIPTFYEGVASLAILSVITAISSLAVAAVGAIASKYDLITLLLGVANIGLVMAGIALIASLVGAIALIPTFWTGLAAMGLLSVITMITSLSIPVIGFLATNFDPMTLLLGVANIGLVMSGIALIASLVGAIALIPTFWSGLAAMYTLTIIGSISSLAIPVIGKLANIYDWKVLLEGVGKIGLVMAAIGMIAVGVGALTLIPFFWTGVGALVVITTVAMYASLAMVAIGKAMDSMSKVKTIDTKAIVSNVKGFISIAKELEPIANVADQIVAASKACEAMARMVDKLSRTVKNVSNLRIDVYEGTKVVGKRELTEEDFTKAATNVKSLITILGSAIVQTYRENPDMFKKGDKGPFAQTVAACTTMSKMISKISNAVKDYAEMKVPIDWDKDGKAKSFRHLGEDDFANASSNVKLIITTLGNAIIDTYKDNPEMFEGGEKGIFGKTTKTLQGLGKLIGDIGGSVGKIAALQIPIDWNNEGKAIKYRTLEKKDFDLAKDNIAAVISTLGNGIMGMYDAHSEWFEESGGSIFSSGKSPFSKVLKVSKELGKLIGTVGESVGDMAALQIPIDWDNKGKAIKFRTLSDADFKLAEDNIAKVITTVGTGIMTMYTSNSDWFEEGGNFFNKTKSPFSKVLNVSKELAKLIGTVGKSVADIAKLQIPIDWDNKGKVTKYRTLENKDFDLAKDNVARVIVAIGEGIMKLYEGDKKTWFEEGGNFFNKTKSPFSKVLETSKGLAKLIATVGSSVANMASLKIPEEWDKEGKPTKFRSLEKKDFDLAKENIGTVISTIGIGLMDMYEGHEDWFKEDFLSLSSSPFTRVMKGTVKLTEIIANVSEGIAKMASLNIPIKWDEEGKPTEFRPINESDFKLAKENIGTVITTIAEGLMEMYDKHPNYFDEGFLGFGDSPFTKVVNGTTVITGIIANVSEGIANLASLSIPIKWNEEGKPVEFRPMDASDFELAKDNIGVVVKTIAEGLMEMYDQHPDWFDEGFLGLGDSPFSKVMNGTVAVGTLIANISEGIANLAALSIPDDWTDEGKPKHFRQIMESDFELAKKNIGTVVTTIANGLMDMYDKHEDWFDEGFLGLGDSPFAKVMNSSVAVGQLLANISEGIVNLAALQIPDDWNDEGKPIHFRQMSAKDFALAKNNIADVVTTIAKGLMNLVDEDGDSFLFGYQLQNIIASTTKIGDLISNIAKGVSDMANLKVAEEWDKNGKPSKYRLLTTKDFALATLNVKLIVTTLGKALADTAKEMSSVNFMDIFKVTGSIDESIKVIGKHAFFLSMLGSGNYIYFDTRQQKERKIAVSEDGMASAAKMISAVLQHVSEGISKGASYASGLNFKDIAVMLKGVEEAISTMAGTAKFMGNLGNGQYIYRDFFENGKEKIIDGITVDKAKNAGEIVKSIITSIADAISTATDKLNSDGFTLFGKSDDDKISLTFKALNKATSMLGKLAEVVTYYANGEVASTTIGKDGSVTVTRSGAPNVENAKKNMSTIITGLADIIKTSSETISEIDDIDETIAGLHKSLKVVDASIYAVNQISRAKSEIESLKGFNFSTILTPVLSDIDKVFEKMNSIGKSDKSSSIFGDMFKKNEQSPLNQFISDANKMVIQSIAIASAPIEESYNKLRNVITSTSETMENFHLPDNFGQQTEELDKFIKSVNTIKIDGVDSLTELLRELNKLGINMGNLDKLTTAISNKLSVTLLNMKQSMDALNKTMIEDGKRKKKHAEQIKKSVSDIRNLMSKTMNVVVKMDDAGSTPGGTTPSDDSPAPGDQDAKKTQNVKGGKS